MGLKSGGGQFRVLGHHDNAYIRSKLLDLDAMVELSLRAKLNRATVLRTAKRFMDLAST